MGLSALSRLTRRPEWALFTALGRADRRLAAAWWGLLIARGVLPALFAIATGALVGAVSQGRSLAGPLVAVGIGFVLLQVMSPLHAAVSANLGSRTSAWLYDRITDACVAPPGLGHLEDPELGDDLTVAREFDLGLTGPPMSANMDFIAGSLVELVAGLAAALVLFGYTWWAPLVLGGAWMSTHWLLKESSVWRDRNTAEVRAARRDADYAFRMAVDPPNAKELRLFGLADWTVGRFLTGRRRLFDLQYAATRLRERSVLVSLVVVVAGNAAVFWSLADAAASGRLSLDSTVVFAQVAVGTSAIAFGGLNWALDGAAAPVAAVRRLQGAMGRAGALTPGTAHATGMPAREIRLRGVSFRYPRTDRAVFDGLDLTIPAGASMAIVGQNGAGKTTLAKLLCRLYEPQSGAIEVDGTDLRDLDVDSWRTRIAAVFQDFTRFELSLRDNVDPARGASDEQVLAALADADAGDLAALDTPLSRSYRGGTDLSGGQWQRVALARALCAVRQGAGLVLLDEPTAQLDVRGEAEIFSRVLAATRGVTTILVSHRFSTVRQADRICVLEHGRVVELGSHDGLIALGGRYRTMFDLQAQRFEEEEELDVL